MSETIKIVPSLGTTGHKMRKSGNKLYPSGTLQSMGSYITDGSDATYQSVADRSMIAICIISKTALLNQILSALPNNASNITINYMSRASSSSTTASQFGSSHIYNVQAYKGNPISSNTLGSAAARDTTPTDYTVFSSSYNNKTEISNYYDSLTYDSIGFAQSGPSTSGYSSTIYDVWLDITYKSGPTIKVKVDGAWEEGELKAKVNGEWVDADAAYVKVNGAWMEIN